MSKLTDFDIEFFELTNTFKQDITDSSKQYIVKKLLKLNNPTYFTKFVKKHPIEHHGYVSSKIINPVLLAISNMLNIIRVENDITKLKALLQTEMSWAYHKYQSYQSVNI
jgi:hypothetical protein